MCPFPPPLSAADELLKLAVSPPFTFVKASTHFAKQKEATINYQANAAKCRAGIKRRRKVPIDADAWMPSYVIEDFDVLEIPSSMVHDVLELHWWSSQLRDRRWMAKVLLCR